MAVARATAIALIGLDGHLVDVEVDVSGGLPGLNIIGLPDAALDEARERVRTALVNSGVGFPRVKTTVNLTPASLPKHGSGFDLAIAVAIMMAQRVVSTVAVAGVAFIGELSLDGRLRPTQGVLPAVAAATRAGVTRFLVPFANRAEAELVPGVRVQAIASLRDAAITLGAEIDPIPVEPIVIGTPVHEEAATPDLADVIGQPDAVRALILAAAGRHHLLLVGPPGAGKSMLAARLPGILPDLDDDTALAVTALRSLVGAQPVTRLVTRPPLASPHHTATAPAIVGGGSGVLRPGAASQASGGVLFLDEAAEFSRTVLDSLRQSLETGEIVIHRARGVARFPAQFQLMMASNPCPCGLAGVAGATCLCTPMVRRRYLARLSGPLLDRIDMQLRLNRVTSSRLLAAEDVGAVAPTDTMRARKMVDIAREAARVRLAGTPWQVNAQVPGAHLRGPLKLTRSCTQMLDRALERGAITMRGYDRALRLAWTCADVAGRSAPTADDIGEALFLRQAVAR